MDRVADRLHLGLEQAAGVGVGDHHRRDVGAEPRLERLEIDPAFLCRRNILDPIAAEGRGRGVGAVRAFGHQHDFARIAARLERGANAQQAAQFAVRAGLGRHRDAVHAGEVDQPESELVDQLDRAADRFLGLERVDVGEAGQPRELLVEPRIVLHRARSEREQAEVDGIILPRQAGVMAHGFGLGEAGEADFGLALEPAEATARDLSCREDRPRSGRVSPISNSKRLLEHQRAVAGDGAGLGHRHWRGCWAASPTG